MLLLDAIGFPLGNAFFSTTTVIPLMLSAVGASKLTLGFLIAMIMVLQSVPGMFAVPWVARLSIVKNYVGIVGLGERLALLPLAYLVIAWGNTQKDGLIIAIFLCFALYNLMMGINRPAYFVLVGKVIPAQWRGRLYGFAGGIAGIFSIGIDYIMRNVVFAGDNGGFPYGFSMGFVIGFVLLTISLLPLFFVKEQPLVWVSQRSNSVAVFYDVWKHDSRFRQLAVSQIIFVLSTMMIPFLVLYAKDVLSASDANLATYATALLLSSSLGSLLLGFLADRYGNFVVYRGCMIMGAACALFALFCKSPTWFTLAFVVQGMSMSGVGITSMNLVMELAGSANRIGVYSTLYATLTSIPAALAPVLGSLIVSFSSYTVLFTVCVLVVLVSLCILAKQKPKHQHQFT